MDDTHSLPPNWERENDGPDAPKDLTDWPAELIEAFPATHDRWLEKSGHLHDTITDSTHLRQRRSKPFMTAFERLAEIVDGPLIFATVNLPDFAGRPLYSKTTINAARRRAQGIIQASGGPGVWKLERGLAGGYHLHLVLSGGGDVSDLDDWREVDDLDGLAKYLSKPADARTCKSRPRPQDLTADLRRRQLAASEEFLTTRRPGQRYTFHGQVGLGVNTLRLTAPPSDHPHSATQRSPKGGASPKG